MPHVFETDQPWKDDPFKAAKARLLKASKVKVLPDNNTNGHNAFYGGCLSTGKISYIEHACHAYTRSLVDCEVLFSRMVHSDRVQGPATTAATKAYFRWITGPSSPWREVFPLGMTMDGPEFRPLFWWRYGFLFDKLNVVPANLLQNFLIATRIPKEWPHHIRQWHRLVLGGCSEAAALFFTPMFVGAYENKERDFTHANQYDFPLDHGTSPEEYLQNFCAGVMPELSKPFRECKSGNQIQYWPVNCLWGENKIETKQYGSVFENSSYAFSVRDRYSKTIGKRTEMDNVGSWPYIKKFPDHPCIYWKLTTADIVKVVKQEERRLGLV